MFIAQHMRPPGRFHRVQPHNVETARSASAGAVAVPALIMEALRDGCERDRRTGAGSLATAMGQPDLSFCAYRLTCPE